MHAPDKLGELKADREWVLACRKLYVVVVFQTTECGRGEKNKHSGRCGFVEPAFSSYLSLQLPPWAARFQLIIYSSLVCPCVCLSRVPLFSMSVQQMSVCQSFDPLCSAVPLIIRLGEFQSWRSRIKVDKKRSRKPVCGETKVLLFL